MERTFGINASALSEVLWEETWSLHKARAHFVASLQGVLLARRAREYAEAVLEKGAPMDKFMGFIDCKKMQMNRPSGPSAYQRSAYSRHKRFHCIIYQRIKPPDGLKFHIKGPDVGWSHGTTLRS